jgi:predicted alpha/beta superfamily hydrolase
LGGLFAIHALLTTPGSFTHYLLGSPSLYWNDEVMFERERAYSRKHRDLPARVFLSVGTNEGAVHSPAQEKMVRTFYNRY